MKRTLIAAAGLALFAATGLAGAASWSVIVQPGVYGRVAIGGYAEAPLVYAPQPVVAIDNGYGEVVEETVDPAYATDQPPVYLWVPEYQRTHWAQYCREYGAYGVPVYFVDDAWYRANVMRRNWTPEQRSWSQQQWLEQDRLARDRFERQRFEQQRSEQQQRWESERVWHDQQQQQRRRDDAQQAGWDHARAEQDPNRMRWGSARGYMPSSQTQGQPPQSASSLRPQPGGAPSPQAGGHWQQGGNGGRQGGYAQGSAGNAQTEAGGGRPGGFQQGNGGNAGQQPASASQAHGATGAPAQARGDERGRVRGEDRGQGRGEALGDRGGRHGQAEGHGAFERGRDGNRDR